MPNVQVSSYFRKILLSSVLIISAGSGVYAQEILDPSKWLSVAPEGDKIRQQDLKKAGDSREYKPLQIGNWLVESNARAGAVFDSNLYSSRYKKKSATGISFEPLVTGRYSDGAQNTTFYLQGDVRHFTTSDDITNFGGRIGIGNSLELQRGTVWKALVQIGRSQDDAGSFNATGSGAGNTGVYVKPINSNTLFAATSVLSRLDYGQYSGFWSAGVSSSLTRYEDAELSDGSTIDQSSRDTNTYTATGRVGLNVAPVVYAFVEPSASLQQSPNVTDGDSSSYRITAGLGTDRINLVRGEVFAGYASQTFIDLANESKDGFVYGGRVSWFPLKELTVNLTADDSLGVTAENTGGVTTLYSSRTRSLATDLSYQLDRHLTASIRASLSDVEYSQSGRKDDIIRAGADVTYAVSGNLGLRVGFSKVSIDSSIDQNSLDRDIYLVGLNGRF